MRLLLLAQGFENGALFGLLVGVGLLLGAGAGAFGFGGSALVGMGCKLRFAGGSSGGATLFALGGLLAFCAWKAARYTAPMKPKRRAAKLAEERA